ncbi:MAG: FecR domain-containing protein [Myxococcota bacterium]
MAGDLQRDLGAVRDVTRVSWSSEETELAIHRFGDLRAKRARHRRARRRVVTLGVIGVVAATVWWPSGGDRVLASFDDGSRVTSKTADTQIAVRTSRPELIEVGLNVGSARFEVAKRRRRVFRVLVDETQIEVLGTVFSVERSASGMSVEVEEGRVRVVHPQNSVELVSGERMTFPSGPPPTAKGRESAESVRPPRLKNVDPGRSPRRAKPRERWQKAAKRGALEKAYDGMKRQGVVNRAEELLLAADVARMTGHPEEALPYLRRVIADHAKDPRAPLAAFTLGKLLLQDLGRPRQAAKAFRQVARLDTSDALREDALAREIECHYRVGDEERARELANRYLLRYPRGRRAEWVRRYGGLSAPSSP